MNDLATDNEDTLLISLDEIEKLHVMRVLEQTQWHKGKTCEILGVSRPRLRRMMVNYAIEEVK